MEKKSINKVDCKHEIIMCDLCTICGSDVSSTVNSKNLHPVVFGENMKIVISENMLKRQMKKNSKRLLSRKKLLLILDLDHTLIHACPNNGNLERLKQLGYGSDVEALKEIYKFRISKRGEEYLIKLRPMLHSFLTSISPFFDLRVYTMGIRSYAERILSIIDPSHSLIGKRFVSRDDFRDERKLLKNHNRLFPVKRKMVIVLDDRVDVWKKISSHVIQVPKFYFFGDNKRVENPKELLNMASAFELKSKDNVLDTAKNILISIHKTFYRENPSTPLEVKNLRFYQNSGLLIKKIRKNVLKGVVIVFSGIHSSDVPIESTAEWELARKFGAKVVKEFSSGNTHNVTHVVGFERQTEKTKLAKKSPRVQLVNVFWLHHSANHFVKADESKFRMISDSESRDFPLICWNELVNPVESYVEKLGEWILGTESGKKGKENKLFTNEEIDKELEDFLEK